MKTRLIPLIIAACVLALGARAQTIVRLDANDVWESVFFTPTNKTTLLTAFGTTGTGNIVLGTSPTLITPNIGVATATSLTLSGTATLKNGSAAAPSFVWAGGSSSGLYNYDDGVNAGIGFSIAGVYVARMSTTNFEYTKPTFASSNGVHKFGASVSNPSGHKLTLDGGAFFKKGSGTALTLGNDVGEAGGTGTTFNFDETGNGALVISTLKQGSGYGTLTLQPDGGTLNLGGAATTVKAASKLKVTGDNRFVVANDTTITRLIQATNTAENTEYFGITASSSGVSFIAGTSGTVFVVTAGAKTALIGTTGVNVYGTTTNDNAATGYVGEYVSSTVPGGSAVSLTTNSPANVTSISLTAGDWDVAATAYFNGTGATVTEWLGGISTGSITVDAPPSYMQIPTSVTGWTDQAAFTVPTRRISIAATTTIYLVARAKFSAGTQNAFGGINARRVR